jgi:hypothetical protein
MAGRWMARPVYPQLRKYASVPALTLRAMKRHRGICLILKRPSTEEALRGA